QGTSLYQVLCLTAADIIYIDTKSTTWNHNPRHSNKLRANSGLLRPDTNHGRYHIVLAPLGREAFIQEGQVHVKYHQAQAQDFRKRRRRAKCCNHSKPTQAGASPKSTDVTPSRHKPFGSGADPSTREHRRRKKNHVKYLEEDAIHLREMIATAENESSALVSENEAMKSSLSASGVKPQTKTLLRTQPTIFLPPQEYESFSSLKISDSAQKKRRTIKSIDYEAENDKLSSYISDMLTRDNTPRTNYFPNGQDVRCDSGTSIGSHVSIQFDEFVNASCLHISDSSRSSSRGPGVMDLSKPLPPLPGHVSIPHNTSQIPSSPDLSIIAINFILALEHPCRIHFHHTPDPPPPFDPNGNPSGHELMASTHIFAHAPAEAFNDPAPESSWSSSLMSLAQLHAMSQSLPPPDYEITPVQAWFKIAEKYHHEIEKVVETSRIEGLKRGLGSLSRCYRFGAVMDVEGFWEVVDEVMTRDDIPLMSPPYCDATISGLLTIASDEAKCDEFAEILELWFLCAILLEQGGASPNTY
ncbi:hypothetical protein DSL72_008872, partial [Monilinia vaccinii-corymbosi]